MYISEILLRGFLRMPLYKESEFHAFFDHKLIMLEGENGSGKSRLLNELTALPADKEDYNENGYKKIVIHKDKSIFTMISDFTGRSPKYSFLKDDVELNQANLLTAQKELAYTYFKQTKIIHELMIDYEKFTDLSFNGRKKFLSTLSKLNIDHVLKSYSKLNDEANLTKLMIKTEYTQFKLEEAKLLDIRSMDDLKSSLKALNSSIDKLLEIRAYIYRYFNSSSSESSLLDLRQLIDYRNTIIRDNFTLLSSHPKLTLEDKEQTEQTKQIETKTQLNSAYERLAELNELKSKVEASSQDLKYYLEEELSRVQLSHSLKESLHYFTVETDPSVIHTYFRYKDALIHLIEESEVNLVEGELIYTSAKLKSYEETTIKDLERLNFIKRLEDQHLEHQKAIKDRNHKVNCPRCHLNFRVTDDTESEMTLEQINDEIFTLTKKIEEQQQYISRCQKYFETYKFLHHIFKSTQSEFKTFWEIIFKENLFQNNIPKLKHYWFELGEEIQRLEKYFNLQKELKDLRFSIKLIEETKAKSDTNFDVPIQFQHDLCGELMDEFEKRSHVLNNIRTAKALYVVLDGLKTSYKNTKDQVHDYMGSYTSSQVLNVLDIHIRELRLQSVELTNSIHTQDKIQYTVDSMRDKITDLEETLEVLEIMLSELSPKNGIIANTISSFLNVIVDNINHTLERIWSYKMVLTPIDVSTHALDYKFKVEVEDTSKTNDIGKTSRGMQEGINLAFKLVLYKLLEMENYPLFLDELASNMSAKHTANMCKLIYNFSVDSNFSQIFIVTHKEDLDFLSDVQTIRLD